eukprot:288249-Hanusia_phi.AAC.1
MDDLSAESGDLPICSTMALGIMWWVGMVGQLKFESTGTVYCPLPRLRLGGSDHGRRPGAGMSPSVPGSTGLLGPTLGSEPVCSVIVYSTKKGTRSTTRSRES